MEKMAHDPRQCMKAKNIRHVHFILFLTTLCFWMPLQPAKAWGNRGHHTICEAAGRLVREKALASFVQFRSHTLGHLCNIPDIYWKNISAEINEIGRPSHHMRPENVGLKLEDVPTVFQDLSIALKQKPDDLATSLGSLWWRADQFYRYAVQAGREIRKTPFPKTDFERQDENQPYNKAVIQMLIHMGVMGHFVGDASMPYHNTADFDGYKNGHGGIHFYYEDLLLNEYSLRLVQEVYEKALRQKQNPATTKMSVVERMKLLSISAKKDMPKLEALDKRTRPSALDKSGVRLPAERPSAEKTAPVFKYLIVDELARSARLLASLWDEIYVESGRPDLSHYASWKYPLTPEFLPPDYTK